MEVPAGMVLAVTLAVLSARTPEGIDGVRYTMPVPVLGIKGRGAPITGRTKLSVA